MDKKAKAEAKRAKRLERKKRASEPSEPNDNSLGEAPVVADEQHDAA